MGSERRWWRWGKRGGSEAGAKEGPLSMEAATAAAASAETDGEVMELSWSLEPSDFQVDNQPRPPRESPLMDTTCGLLTFSWQLVLTYTQEQAVLHLRHKTPGIPDPNFTFNAYFARKDGNLRELSPALLLHLARTRTLHDPSSKGLHLHLHVLVSVSRSLGHPFSLIAAGIREAEEARTSREGEVGERLWLQTLDAAAGGEAKDEIPDVRFRCAKGEIVYAHRSVLVAFSTTLKDAMASHKAGTDVEWELPQRSAGSIRELTYFLYNRRVSPDLGKVDLCQVLDTMCLFEETDLLRLEVERILLAILHPDNMAGLAILAQEHHLSLLDNVIRTVTNRHFSPSDPLYIPSLSQPPSQPA